MVDNIYCEGFEEHAVACSSEVHAAVLHSVWFLIELN